MSEVCLEELYVSNSPNFVYIYKVLFEDGPVKLEKFLTDLYEKHFEPELYHNVSSELINKFFNLVPSCAMEIINEKLKEINYKYDLMDENMIVVMSFIALNIAYKTMCEGDFGHIFSIFDILTKYISKEELEKKFVRIELDLLRSVNYTVCKQKLEIINDHNFYQAYVDVPYEPIGEYGTAKRSGIPKYSYDPFRKHP